MNDKPTEPFPMLDPNAPKLRDPIENWWLVEYDLDYTSVGVRESDPDHDGYSNLDEFLGKTNPNFSLSKPTWDTKLYYAERREEPLSLRLNSVDNGNCSIAFITKDAQGTEQRRNEYIQVGKSNVRGDEPGRFTVLSVGTTEAERFGTKTQVATATLVDNKDPKRGKVVLEQGKAVDHPTYVAHFVYTLTNQTFDVKEGEDFEPSRPAGTTVTVEEIHADRVVVSFIPEGKPDPVRVEKKLAPPPK
jgi:hypothetical protein